MNLKSLVEKNKFSNKKKKRDLIGLAIVFVLILGVPIFQFVIVPFVWGPIGFNIVYSSGERVGKVIKIAEKGLIWKTTEAEMVLSQGGFSVTYIWSFSVDENDNIKNVLLSKLSRAFTTGENIKIKYEQRAGYVPWRSKTAYLLKEIKFENE